MYTITIRNDETGEVEKIHGFQYLVFISTDDDLPSNPDGVMAQCNPIFAARAQAKQLEG